jgi:hypothetical protein
MSKEQVLYDSLKESVVFKKFRKTPHLFLNSNCRKVEWILNQFAKVSVTNQFFSML